MKQNLSTLKKVRLRDVWGHEAIDFTNWLAKPENLDTLSDEIGVQIKLIRTEASVGKFNVDVLAEEETSGRKVIIENQLESTNHDHLGKIITYASGYNAEVIIWIVQDVREEHERAIEWLNEHTDESVGFFLVRIELWQIENSDPAPKFDIIVSPNEWAKTIKTNSAGDELTETKLRQLEFWNKFKERSRQRDASIRLQAPRPQNWYSLSMGSSEAHVSLTVNSRDQFFGCELYIPRNKQLFAFLESRKKEIEEEIGENAVWTDARVASGVKIRKQVDDVFDSEKAEDYFDWLYQKTILFQETFKKFLKEFKAEQSSLE